MRDHRRAVSERVTATRIRPVLFVGSIIAVFMSTVLTLAVIVAGNNTVSGNSVVRHGLVHAAEKGLAVVGKDVGGPDQWPDDGQNPS